MSVGRFWASIGALVWDAPKNQYLLLKRSQEMKRAPGVWECVTGRVDQGESFEEAVQREALEELGVAVHILYIIGTDHFYRGEERLEHEMLGVVYCCSLDRPEAIKMSIEHAEYRWVRAEDAYVLLSASGQEALWVKKSIERAEAIRTQLPALLDFYRQNNLKTSL